MRLIDLDLELQINRVLPDLDLHIDMPKTVTQKYQLKFFIAAKPDAPVQSTRKEFQVPTKTLPRNIIGIGEETAVKWSRGYCNPMSHSVKRETIGPK